MNFLIGLLIAFATIAGSVVVGFLSAVIATALEGMANAEVESPVVFSTEQHAAHAAASDAMSAFILIACLILGCAAYRLNQHKGHLTEWPNRPIDLP